MKLHFSVLLSFSFLASKPILGAGKVASSTTRKVSEALTPECEEFISCAGVFSPVDLHQFIEDAEAPNGEICAALMKAWDSYRLSALCNGADAFAGDGSRTRSLFLRHEGSLTSSVGKKGFKKANSSHHRTLQQGPVCLAQFAPAYADASGTDTSYDTWIASIGSGAPLDYLLGGKLDRSDADLYSALRISLAAAQVADGVSGACDNDLLEILTLGACLAAQVATELAVAGIQIAVDQLDTHDGLIDSTEIEAAYENTRLLLDQTCSLIGQVGTFEATVNTRFNTVDQVLADFETNVINRFDTVDQTLATFEANVLARFGQVDEAIVDLKDYVGGRLDTIEATLEARFNQIDRQLAMLRTLAITPEGRKTGFNSRTSICDGEEGSSGNCALVANYP